MGLPGTKNSVGRLADSWKTNIGLKGTSSLLQACLPASADMLEKTSLGEASLASSPDAMVSRAPVGKRKGGRCEGRRDHGRLGTNLESLFHERDWWAG